MTLQIQRSFNQREGLWNIRPIGEVDISTASTFRTALDDAYSESRCNILLDFNHLTYMDSTGLGVIIGAYDRMKKNGNNIILQNPRENIKRLLRITNLDKLLCPELCE